MSPDAVGPPDGITFEQHRELVGRARYVWVRRTLLCVVAALPLLALLNVFGQHPATTYATRPAADLSVTAPTRLRGGLIFQVRVRVDAHRLIKQPQLELGEGWWESMSVNAVSPEPEQERYKHGRVQLTYGELQPGQSLVARIYFQVNPTNVGKRSEDVVLADGETPILTIHRSLTIFP